jgi:hypothetical protein
MTSSVTMSALTEMIPNRHMAVHCPSRFTFQGSAGGLDGEDAREYRRACGGGSGTLRGSALRFDVVPVPAAARQVRVAVAVPLLAPAVAPRLAEGMRPGETAAMSGSGSYGVAVAAMAALSGNSVSSNLSADDWAEAQ